ncbi:MAG: hypothetical protein N2322_00080 [Terrimicrobiaceae bacterium]|nr:hypothetical protein [Terrimicrobiaceae bacterium]
MSPRTQTISIFGNEWGLLELPRRPSPVIWSFEEALEKIAEAGFDGCQADASRADAVRKAGLRFAASGRVNTPSDARPAHRARGGGSANPHSPRGMGRRDG